MNSCHELFLHYEVPVKDLFQGILAVGCVGGITDSISGPIIGVVVDDHDKHGSILIWGTNYYLLSTTLDAQGGLVNGSEESSVLVDILGTRVPPRKICGIILREELNFGVVIKHQEIIANIKLSGLHYVHAVMLDINQLKFIEMRLAIRITEKLVLAYFKMR